MKTREIKYRPDIDGLRAIAVLSVLLFHTKLGCSGGFVGVDIFFVISGYLISSLILKEFDAGAFSLTGFWERRIRRIMPALAAVVFATFIAGWFLFLPEDFAKLGTSITAQMTLTSNFYFYQQWLDGRGYFTPNLDPKPLLHTWSLAVEEQFYLLFPLLFIFLKKRQKWVAIAFILVVFISSFALSIYGSHHFQAATFYLLPGRAWELLLGSLLTLVRGKITLNPIVAEIIGILGIVLISYSICFYNTFNEFPGLAATVPCLGAAFIIASSEARLSCVGQVLSLPPMVFIGKISYSLYLWHWPLLIYAKYPLNNLNTRLSLFTLLLSGVLAVLSWKLIETPFRQRRVFKTGPLTFWFAGIATTVLLAIGIIVVEGRGLFFRYSGTQLGYAISRCHTAFRNSISLDQAVSGQFPEIGTPDTNQPIQLLIWGDSHAMAVTPILDELCRQYGWRGIQATHSSTAPVLNFISTGGDALRENSVPFNQAVLDFIRQHHIKNVVITAYWKDYPADDEFKAGMLLTAGEIMKAGAKLYLLKDVPTQSPDVANKIADAILHRKDLENIGITPRQYREVNQGLAGTFDQISHMGATILEPANYFLNHNGLYGVTKGDEILYCDGQHLTVEGSRILTPLFQPIFVVKN